MQYLAEGVDEEFLALAVEVFGLLADETRVRIVLTLGNGGEMSVGHLAESVGKAPTAVSQHLAKLRLARMVTTRQDGTKVFYRLANEHASELVASALHQAEHAVANGDVPRHHRLATEAR
jgi:DNA-binding transcriptional ArsR family regulator